MSVASTSVNIPVYLVNYDKFTSIQNQEMENRVKQANLPYDTVGMNHAALEAFKAALECDKFDRQPNEKGKIKIRYRQANQSKMLQTSMPASMRTTTRI